MRYAILADIHSNWEALERVLDYLSNQKIDEIWTLGDTVGYGANPNECLRWAFENAHVNVVGNHERAIVDEKVREWFTENAGEAIDWTAGRLEKELKEKVPEMNYLHIANFATAVHGSPHEPEEFHYLFTFEDARPSFRSFKTPVCFIGHTHVPSQFIESKEKACYLPAGIYRLDRKERYILNPGSVGQPREKDKRLSFGIFDEEDWTFEIVRLEYDNVTAAEKIRRVGLPDDLARRLL